MPEASDRLRLETMTRPIGSSGATITSDFYNTALLEFGLNDRPSFRYDGITIRRAAPQDDIPVWNLWWDPPNFNPPDDIPFEIPRPRVRVGQQAVERERFEVRHRAAAPLNLFDNGVLQGPEPEIEMEVEEVDFSGV